MKPLPKHISHNDSHLFSPFAILPNVLSIAFVIGCYYLLLSNNIMPDKQVFFYWTMKVIIGFNILAASARSLFAPIFAVLIGILSLFTSTVYNITLITSAESWQLIMVALVGFVILITFRL